MADPQLLTMSGLVLLLLAFLLTGGLWIGLALLACGFAAMTFVGGGVPMARCDLLDSLSHAVGTPILKVSACRGVYG